MASFFLDFTANVIFPDDREGGELIQDVTETSFELGFRPALSVHLLEALEAYVEGWIPLVRGGSGAGAGIGILGGITVAY